MYACVPFFAFKCKRFHRTAPQIRSDLFRRPPGRTGPWIHPKAAAGSTPHRVPAAARMSSKSCAFLKKQQEQAKMECASRRNIYIIFPHFIISYFLGFVKRFGGNKLKNCTGLISLTAAKIAFDPAGSGALCQEK